MKANELRIGNWILDKGRDRFYQIDSGFDIDKIDDADELDDDYNFQAIPITEEWLLKFGCVKSKEKDKLFHCGTDIAISMADNKIRLIKGNFVCQLVLCEIEFVHQFQNIIFALTGEELILKETT